MPERAAPGSAAAGPHHLPQMAGRDWRAGLAIHHQQPGHLLADRSRYPGVGAGHPGRPDHCAGAPAAARGFSGRPAAGRPNRDLVQHCAAGRQHALVRADPRFVGGGSFILPGTRSLSLRTDPAGGMAVAPRPTRRETGKGMRVGFAQTTALHAVLPFQREPGALTCNPFLQKA